MVKREKIPTGKKKGFSGVQRYKEIHDSASEELGDGGVVDIGVSFDKTWAKRGFTSQTGVVFVISLDTGKVLDYHCLSKLCQKCSLRKSKSLKIGKQSTLHQENVTLILKEVHQQYKLHYKWMVSDGDRKAHSAVEDIYGENCKVEKLDCVVHVQKRMGKHTS